jgi:hypothetical protein
VEVEVEEILITVVAIEEEVETMVVTEMVEVGEAEIAVLVEDVIVQFDRTNLLQPIWIIE